MRFPTTIADLLAVLRVDARKGPDWIRVELKPVGDVLRGEVEGSTIALRLTAEGAGVWGYVLRLEGPQLTRLRLMLELPEVAEPFHIIPGNLFGDNNLSHSGPGHFPNLTIAHPGETSCAPYWEFRADRGALPVSILAFRGGVAAVSIDPYSDCAGIPDGFIRNGVCAQVAPTALGVTLGYRNDPQTFANKDLWTAATEHRLCRGTARGRIHLSEGARSAVHGIMRDEYTRLRELPTASVSIDAGARALTTAFLEVNWSHERKDFTNQHTDAPGVLPLKPWRPLSEIGWTGGGPVGFPLLQAGHTLGIPAALAKGRWTLDRIAGCFNPASGLLWDVYNKDNGVGPGVDWWWTGYLVKGCHCAYTNGSAVSYLLQGYAWLQQQTGEAPAAWRDTACAVLDTMLRLQQTSGNFGYTYRTDRPEILDARGFAGVWFVPALAQASQLTGRADYLAAAEKAFAFYSSDVRELCCWGTPMDTMWAPDQEGVLGFIRAAALLHRLTGKADYLTALGEGAEYEYLWRYGFRARPEAPPLKGSDWNSCGASLTSVSNPHLHPMGLIISAELRYLAEQTGDPYHRARYEDGLQWALNTLALYPGVMGYGRLGVVSERFCPSDGLLIERYPDGTPASTWFSYNGWGAAAMLEGLLAGMEEGA